MRLLIVGCGYLGTRLVQLAHGKGAIAVAGVARNPDTVQKWNTLGYACFKGDVSRPDDLKQALSFLPTHIVYCVAGGRSGGAELYRKLYYEGLKNLMEALEQLALPKPQIFFTSSTSVYPQKNGEWVDENCPDNPETQTGMVLHDTERILMQEYPAGTVLRVAGIYGPNRGVLFERVLNGGADPMDDEPNRWLNFIHVDDIALSILHLSSHPLSQGQIYNLSDDEPIRLVDYFGWIRSKQGLAPAQFAPVQPRPLNKRVSNQKLKTTAGYCFRYPTIREGLADRLLS